jgi:ApaG protein
MVGRYQMQGDGGSLFEVDIPAFSLDMPDLRPTLN